MNKRDPYEVLEVARNASAEDIKRAYRDRAKEYHPDRNKTPEASQKFNEATEAYEILSDEQKRARYDQFGFNEPRQSSHNPFVNFEDFVGSFFRGGFQPQQRNIEVKVDITLEEVLTGVEKPISFKRVEVCATCKGAGGTGKACTTCGGYGQVRIDDGFMVFGSATCRKCHGSGIKIEQSCKTCRGQGRVTRHKTVNVKIPAGIQSGVGIRIQGEGEHSGQGRPGDLICHVSILPHTRFLRGDNADLFLTQRIDMVDACLGCKVEIDTIDGKKVELRIPSGTQFGHVLKIKDAGLPIFRGSGRGHLLIEVHVEIPKRLTEKQQQLLKEFAGAENSGHH